MEKVEVKTVEVLLEALLVRFGPELLVVASRCYQLHTTEFSGSTGSTGSPVQRFYSRESFWSVPFGTVDDNNNL